MPRHLKVAAAQMGPNNEGMSREEIVDRMLALLAQVRKRWNFLGRRQPQHYDHLLDPVVEREAGR
jgi:CRISPR/Cas system Type II protein with McrA/HNH and RuvC-like nuclease domain